MVDKTVGGEKVTYPPNNIKKAISHIFQCESLYVYFKFNILFLYGFAFANPAHNKSL